MKGKYAARAERRRDQEERATNAGLQATIRDQRDEIRRLSREAAQLTAAHMRIKELEEDLRDGTSEPLRDAQRSRAAVLAQLHSRERQLDLAQRLIHTTFKRQEILLALEEHGMFAAVCDLGIGDWFAKLIHGEAGFATCGGDGRERKNDPQIRECEDGRARAMAYIVDADPRPSMVGMGVGLAK